MGLRCADDSKSPARCEHLAGLFDILVWRGETSLGIEFTTLDSVHIFSVLIKFTPALIPYLCDVARDLKTLLDN